MSIMNGWAPGLGAVVWLGAEVSAGCRGLRSEAEQPRFTVDGVAAGLRGHGTQRWYAYHRSRTGVPQADTPSRFFREGGAAYADARIGRAARRRGSTYGTQGSSTYGTQRMGAVVCAGCRGLRSEAEQPRFPCEVSRASSYRRFMSGSCLARRRCAGDNSLGVRCVLDGDVLWFGGYGLCGCGMDGRGGKVSRWRPGSPFSRVTDSP